MKTFLHRTLQLVLLAALSTAGIGCQQAPVQESPVGPAHEGYHRPRNPYFLPRPSLALESESMHQLAQAAGETGAQGRLLAWYDMRNDAKPFVEAGFQTSTLETVYTYTYDRQYQSSGQIRDHYSQTMRRGSISQTVR